MHHDTRLKHPFPTLVAGPTSSGKTYFVKRLLEGSKDTIQNQTLYHDMQETIPNITIVEGVSNDLEATLDPSVRNLIVLQSRS